MAHPTYPARHSGNPAAWTNYGCHPARFYPDVAASWQRYRQHELAKDERMTDYRTGYSRVRRRR